MVSLVDPPPLDLDDAETELYGLTPEEFIPRRKELVAQIDKSRQIPQMVVGIDDRGAARGGHCTRRGPASALR